MKYNSVRGMCILICVSMLFLYGCQNTTQEIIDESSTQQEQAQEKESEYTENMSPNEPISEDSSTDAVMEKEESLVKYETLTEENFEEVLSVYMSISDESELWKLDYIPLTDELRDNLYKDFSYISENKDFEWIRIEAWGINEKEFGCVYRIKTQQDCFRDYYIEMTLEEGKIAEIELLFLADTE